MNDIEILEEFLEDYIHDGLAIQYRVMEAIENLIQRNKLLEKQILEDSSCAMLKKIKAKLKYDINKINEKLLSDKYINDYRKARLKGIRTKSKEILNIIGE